MTGLQLRRLQISGKTVPTTDIVFDHGLNVVSGASNTGKSYIVEVIDFMLGGRKPLRPLPESQGYESVSLSIITHDGHRFNLIRSLQGGNFRLQNLTSTEADNSVTLRAQYSPTMKENISTFLMGLVDLDEKRIRRNANDEVQDLSFRNLAHMVVVDEEKIIRKDSPIFTGETTQRTANISVFKLLLTGQDDSSLVATKKASIANAELGANIILLDQIVEEYEREIEKLTTAPAELADQLERLNIAAAKSRQQLETQRAISAFHEENRQRAWQRRDDVLTRLDEVKGLLERFSLLNQHYESDLSRLEAVSEAGFYFLSLDAATCPLCGAPARDHQHADAPYDADIAALRLSCESETVKIRQLKRELDFAVLDLSNEQVELNAQFAEAQSEFVASDEAIRDILAPAITAAYAEYMQALELTAGVRQAMDLVIRTANLRSKRTNLQTTPRNISQYSGVRPSLHLQNVQEFARTVQELLLAWKLPLDTPVTFDEQSWDLVLGARRRGEHGKGLRALTHAAFSIGLQLTCRRLELPTIGFVVLDSPLVTFREAEPEEAGLNASERNVVKQAFYADLAKRIQKDQVIIVENEDPETSLRSDIVSQIFTGSSAQGRAGFFPGTPS